LYTPQARALQDLEEVLGNIIPDISNNSMGSFGFIHENYQITELRLFQSYFQEQVQITELPESIGNLENLHTLDLSHNLLTELPDSIAELEELEKFYLDYNNFTKIPTVISSLENLNQLNFDENLLTTIPDSLHNSPYLQSIYLSGNMLTDFPVELSELDYLRRLMLSRNEITSIDYTVLDDFSRLYVLDLRSNPIPVEQVNKARAYLRLLGKKRRKYYLRGEVPDWEHPYSLRNIGKRIRSDPLLQIDETNHEEITKLTRVIKANHEQRYQFTGRDEVINQPS